MEGLIRPPKKDNNNNSSSSSNKNRNDSNNNNTHILTTTGAISQGTSSSGHLMNFHMAFIKTTPPAPPPVVLPLNATLLPMVSDTIVVENSVNTNCNNNVAAINMDNRFRINTVASTNNFEFLRNNIDIKNNIGFINTTVNNKNVNFVNSAPSNTKNNVMSSSGHTTHTANNGMYQCGVCLRIFPLPSSLKAHMKTHVEVFLYKCDTCNLQFKWKTAYENHVKKHTIAEQQGTTSTQVKSLPKEGASSGISNLPRKTVFQCEICGKVFGYKCNLELHGAVHSDEKNFVCGTCGRGFKLKMHLDTHMKVHDDFREFKCKICEKQFKLKGNLKTHIKSIHFNERPWPCDVCEKTFKLKQHLLTHIRLKHSPPVVSGPMLVPSATPSLEETLPDPLSLVGEELAREVSVGLSN